MELERPIQIVDQIGDRYIVTEHHTESQNGCRQPVPRRVLNLWREHCRQIFHETRSFQAAETILQMSHKVVISGFIGEGKTSIARKLSLRYDEEGYTIHQVTDTADALAKMAQPEPGKSVFIYDDAFGKYYHDKELARRWDRLGNQITERLDENNKLIVTTRNYVFEQCKHRLSEFIHAKAVLTINSGQFSQTREEKLAILENHIMIMLGGLHRHVEPSYMQSVCRNNIFRLCFPKCCEEYVLAGGTLTFQRCLENIFIKEIRNIMELEEQETFQFLFRIMALNDGTLPVSLRNWSTLNGAIGDMYPGRTSSSHYCEINRSIQHLLGTFIQQYQNIYMFYTSAAWGTVLKYIDPNLVFKYCSGGFIADHMRATVDARNTREFLIVQEEFQTDLLEILYGELRNNTTDTIACCHTTELLVQKLMLSLHRGTFVEFYTTHPTIRIVHLTYVYATSLPDENPEEQREISIFQNRLQTLCHNSKAARSFMLKYPNISGFLAYYLYHSIKSMRPRQSEHDISSAEITVTDIAKPYHFYH